MFSISSDVQKNRRQRKDLGLGDVADHFWSYVRIILSGIPAIHQCTLLSSPAVFKVGMAKCQTVCMSSCAVKGVLSR